MFRSVILVLCVVITVDSARILGLFHAPSFSHCIVGQTLLKALAQRGHQITMISPFPLKTPVKNYEDIYFDETMKFKENGLIKMIMDAENGTIFSRMAVSENIMLKINEIFLDHDIVKNLLSSNKDYDLVIMDWFMDDVLLGIADYYKAPVIVISSAGSTFITNKVTVNPSPYAYVPNLFMATSDEMKFQDRVLNTLSTIFFELREQFSHEPAEERMLQKYFPKAPPLKQLIHNISLVFLNSHFSIESPRPHVPNLIQIGGLHVEEPKELNKELKTFMDDASEGVLYFSLGGNAKISDLDAEKLDAIIKTLGKLPVKVLWKFSSDEAYKLPSNVKTGSWFPQGDILAHPNLRVFVTHGGLLSTTEAIYRGVPMVGVPCFGDQLHNVMVGVHHGYSTLVTLDDLTERTFTDAIMEVLNNSRYRENAKKRSVLLRDQPIKPLDNAIFWAEYVLRHKGAFHLQTSAVKLSWYQYFLLDVFALLTAIVLIIGFVLIKIVKLIKRVIFRKEGSKRTVSKKTKKD